jgi:hypothetical protein
MSPSPEDPLTELAKAAAQVHELFRAYVDSGFSEQQALYLVGKLIAANAVQSPGE